MEIVKLDSSNILNYMKEMNIHNDALLTNIDKFNYYYILNDENKIVLTFKITSEKGTDYTSITVPLRDNEISINELTNLFNFLKSKLNTQSKAIVTIYNTSYILELNKIYPCFKVVLDKKIDNNTGKYRDNYTKIDNKIYTYKDFNDHAYLDLINIGIVNQELSLNIVKELLPKYNNIHVISKFDIYNDIVKDGFKYIYKSYLI